MTPDPDDSRSSSADARRAFGEDASTGGRAGFGALPGFGAPPRPVAPDGPRRGGGERWIPVVVALLGLLLTGLALWRAERGALADPVQQGERGEVVGVEGRSLLREANLRRAVATLAPRLRADEVVTGLDVSPVLVRLTVRDGKGSARSLGVDLRYQVRTQPAGTSTADGRPLTQIDATAPGRLVSTVLRRRGFAPDTVTGVIWRYSASTEQQRWGLMLHDVLIADQQWEGDATAGTVRRPGDPQAPATPVPATPLPAPGTTGSAPRAVPATPARRAARRRTPPRSTAVEIRVGGTRIITDRAAGRRLRACLQRTAGRRAAVRRCVEELRR